VVVGDEDSGAALGELAKAAPHALCPKGVDSGKGLVAEQDAWRGGEHADELEPASFPAREGAGGHVHALAEAELMGEGVRVERRVRWSVCGVDGDVLGDAEVPEHAGRLWEIAKSEAGPAPKGQAGYVTSSELDSARGEGLFACKGAEEGALACTAGAEYAEHLARRDFELDSTQNGDTAEADLDPTSCKNGLAQGAGDGAGGVGFGLGTAPLTRVMETL